MGSTCSTMAKTIISELDPGGDLIPVPSVIHSDRFKPLYLLRRRNVTLPLAWRKHKYLNTGFKLTDVLEAEDPGDQIEILHSEPYKITDTVDGMLAANVAVPDQPINIEIKGAAEISRSRSTVVNKSYVNLTALESIKDRRRINMSHTLIKELEESEQNVYMITETIEAEQESTINISGSLEGSLYFFSKVGIKSKENKKKSISIPKGSVLGFGIQLLKIQNGKWAVSYVPRVKDQTFENDNAVPESSQEGFSLVKAEIQNQSSDLDFLSPEVAADFLKAFTFIMKDHKTLTEVEDRLEQSLFGSAGESTAHLDPSISKLLEYLGISSTPLKPCKGLIHVVLLFMDALNELDEEGVSMLVEAVEKQNTEQQLTQVETLLAENFISSEDLDAYQLSPKGAGPRQILEAHETMPESWNLVVQTWAVALYAALHVLHMLSSLH
ncbi:gasdermin-A3 [Microcaecilia unicolor]|uniref:Gasdermin-A3-like n=1 Tax=Microcaecilia unicolor TaxID=1415580 RepID=A0A6P7ZVR6_9AMPH|nr:gasdermin-A3-like [Microcaecilia unicolor]